VLSGLLSFAFTAAGNGALLGEAVGNGTAGTSSISVSFCISRGRALMGGGCDWGVVWRGGS
jgi:hypothetical protein